MLHFPAVPKDVELAQPQTDVLLLAPGDLLDLALLASKLEQSETILSINFYSKVPKFTSALVHACNIMVWFAQIEGCPKKQTAAQSSALHPRVPLLQMSH